MEGLSYLFRDQLKNSVEKAINEAPWPDGAIKLADRENEIKKLVEKNIKLESEEANIRTEAAKIGLIIDIV